MRYYQYIFGIDALAHKYISFYDIMSYCWIFDRAERHCGSYSIWAIHLIILKWLQRYAFSVKAFCIWKTNASICPNNNFSYCFLRVLMLVDSFIAANSTSVTRGFLCIFCTWLEIAVQREYGARINLIQSFRIKIKKIEIFRWARP